MLYSCGGALIKNPVEMGKLREKKGDIKGAIKYYELYLKENASKEAKIDWSVLKKLGILYYRIGDIEKSINFAQLLYLCDLNYRFLCFFKVNIYILNL